MKQQLISTKIIRNIIIVLSISILFFIGIVVILEKITLATNDNLIIKQDNKYYYVTKYKNSSHDVDTIKIPKK